MAWARVKRNAGSRLTSLALLSLLPGLSACGAFFTCEGKASCGTSGITDTGDVVYASNNASPSLFAYFIASDGSLNAVSGSPYALSFNPISMVLTPDNSLLYVSGPTGITSYVAGAGGVLSGGTHQSTTLIASQSMVISPNSKWLIALDTASTVSSPLIRSYSIGTGGTLGAASSSATINSSLAISPTQVAISSDGKYVAAALGNAGTLLWQFDETAGGTGAFTPVASLGLGSATTADYSVAFDGGDNLYVARSGTNTGIYVYSSTGAALTPSTGPYTTGNAPRSLTFASGYAFLYDANQTDATVGAFSDVTTALKGIGSATAAPSGVQALAVDSSGKYVVGVGTGAAAALELYTIGSSGALTAGKTASAGTVAGTVPVLAVTH